MNYFALSEPAEDLQFANLTIEECPSTSIGLPPTRIEGWILDNIFLIYFFLLLRNQ